MRDDSLRRFDGNTFAPVRGSKSVSQLIDAFFELVGTKSATAHKISVLEQEHWPKLNLLFPHGRHFAHQPSLNLFFGEGASNEPRYAKISPQPEGQREIVEGP